MSAQENEPPVSMRSGPDVIRTADKTVSSANSPVLPQENGGFTAPRRVYAQRPCGDGGTGCTALVDEQPDALLPMTCGWLAAGPHPDPERSYREPLCQRHLDEARSDR